MKKTKIEVIVEELLPSELSADEQALIDSAIAATQQSNAKYSHFRVGAAVRLANGVIVQGANQENASFPLSMCGERTAIFTAQVQYPSVPITVLALCASNDDGLLPHPVSPCGSCRQVMTEVEERYGKAMSILLYGTEKVYRLHSAHDLLPLCFVDDDMR